MDSNYARTHFGRNEYSARDMSSRRRKPDLTVRQLPSYACRGIHSAPSG